MKSIEMVNLNLDKVMLRYMDCFKDMTKMEREAFAYAIKCLSSPILWSPNLEEPNEKSA